MAKKKWKNMTKQERAKVRAKDRQDIVVGLGKELALIGLYAVNELAGIDMHRQPTKGKRSWKKRWGER